ncbi:MAG: hypothetical protein MZU95_09830 [Desulfomicrobium escambiense]|nr:hypothetical protein [Desulfomicrobium escambiense]
MYEYRTRNAANENFGGLTNAWYGKLGVNADLMKNLNMDLGLFYIQAVKKIDTNNPYGFTNTTDSRSIGTEIDAKFTYQIDRNPELPGRGRLPLCRQVLEGCHRRCQRPG